MLNFSNKSLPMKRKLYSKKIWKFMESMNIGPSLPWRMFGHKWKPTKSCRGTCQTRCKMITTQIVIGFGECYVLFYLHGLQLIRHKLSTKEEAPNKNRQKKRESSKFLISGCRSCKNMTMSLAVSFVVIIYTYYMFE
jgi:hypothetical protein